MAQLAPNSETRNRKRGHSGMLAGSSLTIEDLVHCFVAGWIADLIDSRTTVHKSPDDYQVIGFWLVDCRPHRQIKHGSAIHISHFKRRMMAKEELHHLQLAAICSPVEGIHPGAIAAAGIQPFGDKILDEIGVA